MTQCHEDPWLNRVIAGLSLEQQVGQLLVARIVPRACTVQSARDECYRLVEALQPGGFYVGGSGRAEEIQLLDELQHRSAVPLLYCADFEAGVGLAWPEAGTRLPMPLALAAIGDPAAAREAAQLAAREARACGICWNLAPVCDLNLDPDNPIINVRSFGDDPVRVGELVASTIDGFQAEGVLACAKHFPGTGRTDRDSHQELPTVQASSEELDAMELLPFRRAIAASVGSVMTGHVCVPALMGPETLPATLCPRTVTGLLRERLGFDGLVVTDSLKMRSVSQRYTPEQSAVAALAAGADCILLSPDPRLAKRAIIGAVHDGRLSEERIATSVRRVLRAKAWCGLSGGARSTSESHAASLRTKDAVVLSQSLAARAVTVVSDEAGWLPLRSGGTRSLMHIALLDTQSRWRAEHVTAMTAVFRRQLPEVHLDVAFQKPRSKLVSWFHPECRGQIPEALAPRFGLQAPRREQLLSAARRSTAVVVSVHRWTRGYGPAPVLVEPELSLIRELCRLDVPVVVVALASPYVLRQLDWVRCRLATCDWARELAEAAGRVIVGEISALGKLPVALGRGAAGDRPAAPTTGA